MKKMKKKKKKNKNKGKETIPISKPTIKIESNPQPLDLTVDLSAKKRHRNACTREEKHAIRITTPDPTSEDNESKSGGGKRKKARTTFTGKQIYEMERKFEVKKYLSSNERTDMARILNVTETQVGLLLKNIVISVFC